MNKKLFLSLFLSLGLSLCADPDPTYKANAYFEAGEYAKAISIYQELLKEQKLGIKKEVLTYNMGCAQLADKQYTQAIDQFYQIIGKDEQVPKHLLERTHYNLILGYLGLTDYSLDHLDQETPMSSVREAQRALNCAKEQYEAFTDLKYPYLADCEEKPQEFIDLKNSLKELSSKLKRIQEKVVIDSLSFSTGLEKILFEKESRLLYLDTYLQNDLQADHKKYLLTKQSLLEKSTAAYWKRMQEIIQEQYDEAEKEVLHKDKVSQKQDENFELQSAYRALFDQAYNRHLAALDYLKDYNLAESRLAYAKSRLDLTLMHLSAQSQDGLEHCLKEKIALKKKGDLFRTKEAYVEALDAEIEHTNTMALGLTTHQTERIQAFKSTSRDKKTFSKLDELRKVEELDVVHQMMTRLKNRLESEKQPTLDKLCKDYALYLLSKAKPEDVLLEMYQGLKENQELKKTDIEQMDHQFFALLNHFEIQHHFSYDEAKNKRINYALDRVPQIQEYLAQSETKEAKEALKDLLINWNFKRFVAQEIESIQQYYPIILSQIEISYSDVDHLNLLGQEILSYGDALEEPSLHQETLDYLKENFKKVEDSHQLSLCDSYKNKTQKLLLQNGSAWLERMVKDLKEDKLSSKNILENGIKEESLSLNFSQQVPEEHGSSQDATQYFQSLAGESQNYPLQAVQNFEDTFYDEEAESSATSGQSTRNSEVLKFFKAGLVEAEKAQQLIGKEPIKWEEVSAKQTLAIEYWQKALKAYEQDSKNQDSGQQNGDSPQSPQESQGQKNEGASGDLENSGVAQMDEDQQQSDRESSVRDILQKLQEMQQDDQIRTPPSQIPKQGLRPW